VSKGVGVSMESVDAANRYSRLLKLHEKFPHHPLFTLLLAECHFLMNDTSGAHLLPLQARRQLQLEDSSTHEEDPTLDAAIRFLDILAKDAMQEIDEKTIQKSKCSNTDNLRAGYPPLAPPTFLSFE
jgi:hypothetical protein